MAFTTLVSVSELSRRLDDAGWAVCDCRHDLANTAAGRRAYAESHIPGARFLHLDEDLSAPLTGRNGRHPLPDPEKFGRRLGELGISNTSQVVAYDASGGFYAARLWWMLRWVGHDAAAVLDGGWNAWLSAPHSITKQVPEVKPARFVRGAALASTASADEIARELGKRERRLLDARSPDRFRGENETLDPVSGHIPGAVNRFSAVPPDAQRLAHHHRAPIHLGVNSSHWCSWRNGFVPRLRPLPLQFVKNPG